MSNTMAQLFRTLTTGVYVIGVAEESRYNAFTAAWVMQVSFKPLYVAVSINPDSASYGMIKRSRAFSVNVLGEGHEELAERFGTNSGAEHDKLGGVAWRKEITGCPVLNDAVAFFECRLSHTSAAGDHELAVAKVINGAIQAPERNVLRYAQLGNLDGALALYPEEFPGEYR